MASMDNSQGKVQKGFHVFFTYMLPILFTSMCYIIMYIKVRYSRRSRQVRAARKNVANVDDDAVRQWDDHVTRTILVIFVFMVLCCVPHLVVHIRHLYDRHPAAWLLLHLVFWLQFCIDPLVYVTISCQYRAACAETARRLMQCLGLSSREEPTERSVCFKEREDVRSMDGQPKFGKFTLAIKGSINILGMEVDSKLSFDRHLESVARKACLMVILLRRVRQLLLLDTKDLMTLYKAQVRPIMEYISFTGMSNAQSHLSLLDKVQRRARRFIHAPMEHRRRIGSLTVLHKAQVLRTPHLAYGASDAMEKEKNHHENGSILLKVPRCRSVSCQRTFTHDISLCCGTLTSSVDGWTPRTRMSTQQVKCATYACLASDTLTVQ
ncbi:G-protein coupled receptor moody [Portunus trituberculatus]|uniref:G-protein coupled receptor moody n=1 Tax=Portunus trituberculatus TaxID=210409 RepID=A0A5B7E6C7_PORTR|nr:G-protein coupled receptor moody [Portunus trituberculatus]